MPILAILALCLQTIGIYAVWPSRWNVVAHLGLGFCVTAYIFPGFATGLWDDYEPHVVEYYALLNVTGAAAMLVGLFAGAHSGLSRGLCSQMRPLFNDIHEEEIRRRTEFLAIAGIVGMSLAYLIMGFIPMFADDPFSAKQFKGDYQEPYHRADYLFRFSFFVLVVILPILLLFGWSRRRFKPFALSGAAVTLLTISLSRAASLTGVLSFLGVLAARPKGWFWRYIVLVGIIFPLGSAAYLLLGLLLGVERLTAFYQLDSIAEIVSSGAPDLRDQLTLLTDFLGTDAYTYGRTIFGGLIPGNYRWNPSVWTLTFSDVGADISEMVTGGLRLSPALWGYANFGWFGVLALPCLAGYFAGAWAGALRALPLQSSPLAATLCIGLQMTLGKQMSEFYLMSIHILPSIAAVWFVCFGLRLRTAQTEVGAEGL